MTNRGPEEQDEEAARLCQQGAEAAAAGKRLADNPETVPWRRHAWMRGWNAHIAQGKSPRDTGESMAKAAANGDTGKRPRLVKEGERGVQQTLDIPGDTAEPLDSEGKRLAKFYANAIMQRCEASDDESSARKKCEDYMTRQNLEVMHLPNGGKLLREEHEPEVVFKYVGKKKAKEAEAAEAGK